MGNIQRPGSRGALLPPSPLRTVRDRLPSYGSSPSKAKKHPMDVSSLAGRVMSSLRLSTRIHPITGWPWLLPSSHPIPPTAALRLACHKGRRPGVTTFRVSEANTLGPLCLPAGVLPVSDVLKALRATHLPFWSKPHSSFGLSIFTTVTSVHLR
jgi:hypothetical protein